MWAHPAWKFSLFAAKHQSESDLSHYATLFNSVEGNTSFYHLPTEQSMLQWAQTVPENFRFTFKFPQQLSHQSNLLSEPHLLDLAIQRFSLLENKLGCLMLQLPASFSPNRLDELGDFFKALPTQFNYAVEVRHLGFFDKSDNERRFNQLLSEFGINRVIMDTRGLFACQDTQDPVVKDVQQKKPKVPTNVIATADQPIIRFVGHPELDENIRFLTPWIHKIKDWQDEGKTPFLFFHMPDNSMAPWLAELFFQHYRLHYPDALTPNLKLPAHSSTQMNMFS